MTCADAYRGLMDLSHRGWLVEIRSAVGGGVLVIACRGDREIRETGPCVAAVAPAVIRQARAWFIAPSPLTAAA